MNNSGPLSFEAVINDSNFMARMEAMERRTLGFTRSVERETDKIDQAIARLGQLAAGAFVFSNLAQLPEQLLKVRGEMQQLEIAYTSMLKSKSKGQALLADVVKEASTNPFTLSETAQGAKQLLAYGTAAKDIVPTLRMLTDIASGTGDSLTHLTYVYGTLRTQGRAYMRDIQQFATVGVPIYDGLAKVLGVNVDKINEFVEKGKVGFKEVDAALKSLTTTGGIFAGLGDAQSKSLIGLKNQLASAYQGMLNDIGSKNEGILASSIKTASAVVENYQTVIDSVEVLIGAYGGYRAALVVASVAQELASMAQIRNTAVTQAQAIAQAEAASTTSALSISQRNAAIALAQASQAQAAGATLAARAQLALNAAMNINPVVLIGTALAALTAAYFVFREEATKSKTAQELLAESAKEVDSRFNKQKGEITNLIATIKNQNVAESQRLKAYEKLKEISPDIVAGLDFQRAKTADLTSTLNTYLISLRKKIQLESAEGKSKEAYDAQAEAATRLREAEDALIANQKNTARTHLGNGVYGDSPLELAQKALAQARKVKAERDKTVDEVEASIGKIYSGKASREQLEAEISHQQRVLASIPNKLSPLYKAAEETLKNHQAELTRLNNDKPAGKSFSEQLAEAESIGSLRAIKAIADTDDKLEELQKKVKERLGSAVRGSQDKAELTKLNADINYALGKRTKEQKENAKVGPLGSESYYDHVIKKIDIALSKVPKDNQKEISRLLTAKAEAQQKVEEIKRLLETPAGTAKYFESIATAAQAALEKIPVSNPEAIARQKQIVIDAQAQAEEARKKIAIRSLEEETEFKKTQYELFQKWAETYGQAAADTQFAELKKSGQSYFDYLNTQIDQLEAQRDNVGLTDKQVGNLSFLIDQRNAVTGQKTAIDLFRDSLQEARVNAGSLADYLEILKQKQAELDTKPNTTAYFELRKEVATNIVETKQQLKDQLTGYLQDVAGAEQQRLAIQKKYADLRLALEQQYSGKAKGAIYETALNNLKKGEADEIKDVNERATQASAAYKKLDEVILSSGRKAMRERLAQLNTYLKEEAKAVGTQTYQQKLKERNDLLLSMRAEDIRQYASTIGQFGQALSQFGGQVGEVGTMLVSLAANFDLVGRVMDKNLSAAERVSIGIQGVTGLFTALLTASENRKKADADYYRNAINFQSQYNLLLNEELGLKTKNRDDIFGRDYIGEMSDNYAKLTDAQDKYQESLKKLAQGKAKVGLRNQLDNKTALGLIGSGAATGAAIGSFFGPGVGTAIGAAIGGIVGGITSLFGGATKKAEEFGDLLTEYPELLIKGKDGVYSVNVALGESLIATNQVDDATKDLIKTTIEWQKQIDEAKAAIKEVVKTLVGNLGDKLGDSLVKAFVDGTDAALAFKQTLDDMLEDFITKLIYSKVLMPYLEQFGKEVEQSLGPDGDGSIFDDTARLYAKRNEILTKENDYLQQAQDAAKAAGFDILKNKTKSLGSNSVSGAIQASVTEATANVLEGSINAIRIQDSINGNFLLQLNNTANRQLESSFMTHDIIRSQLLALNNIDRNTQRIEETNEWLRRCEKRLKDLSEISYNGIGGLPRYSLSRRIKLLIGRLLVAWHCVPGLLFSPLLSLNFVSYAISKGFSLTPSFQPRALFPKLPKSFTFIRYSLCVVGHFRIYNPDQFLFTKGWVYVQ